MRGCAQLYALLNGLCFLMILAVTSGSAKAQTVTAFQCGLYDKRFDSQRRELNKQKGAEFEACGQKYDQINRTFTWFDHCVVALDNKYKPHFDQIDAQQKQHEAEARRCTAEADRKLEAQKKQQEAQEAAQRRAEEQQVQAYNDAMARSNAERDAWNRAAQERNRQVQEQYAAQQRAYAAQQVAAQRQAQIQAEQEAARLAERARAEAELQGAVHDLRMQSIQSGAKATEERLAAAHGASDAIDQKYAGESSSLAAMLAKLKADAAVAAAKAEEIKHAIDGEQPVVRADVGKVMETVKDGFDKSRKVGEAVAERVTGHEVKPSAAHEISEALTESAINRLGTQTSDALNQVDGAFAQADSVIGGSGSATTMVATAPTYGGGAADLTGAAVSSDAGSACAAADPAQLSAELPGGASAALRELLHRLDAAISDVKARCTHASDYPQLLQRLSEARTQAKTACDAITTPSCD